MSIFEVESVQLYGRTDRSTHKDNHLPSQTTHDPFQADYLHWPTHLERLLDRTVHPLWETRMQMRRYRRPWSQILSVGQLSGTQARTRVCVAEIPRAGQGLSGQLSEDQTHVRRDFQYQSRTVATKRQVVKNKNGHPTGGFHFKRDRGFRNHRGKYASIVGRRSAEGDRHLGGIR